MRQLLLKISFLLFVIFLLSILGCEKKYSTIVDSTGYAPILNNASFSESIINTDTINIAGQSIRSPNDLITIRGIAKVTILSSDNEKNVPIVGYSVTNSQFSSSLTEGVLHDDGVFPDAKANDSVYSGYVEFQIQRVVIGSFSLNIRSESTTGYNSNTLILPLQIVRLNHPPVLSNLQADSLVSIGGVDHVLQLRITASDSDGQSDILRVFFNTFKPNGSPSSVNPQIMYDDGNANQISGDLIAGDGIYGLGISLPRTTSIGTYRFEFYAVDRSNDTSNVIVKNIVVTN